MEQFPVAKEGWPFIAVLIILSAIVYQFSPWWALLPITLSFFTAFFFRNPRRIVPAQKDIIVAPADGVILEIQEQYEQRYLKNDAVKIRIYLSLFNVHVNRSPCDGRVDYVHRFPGKFLMANRKEAGEANSKNCLGLQTPWGRVLVVQITGFIARRIVCWAEEGDLLKMGQRFGLIKFGSCTELYLPKNVTLNVKPGDKVKGGITILGRFPV